MSLGIIAIAVAVVGVLAYTFLPRLTNKSGVRGYSILGATRTDSGGKSDDDTTARLRLIIIGLVTVIVLFLAGSVIRDPNATAADKNWASGAVGTILGFWLKA
jgi:hypothetical protein